MNSKVLSSTSSTSSTSRICSVVSVGLAYLLLAGVLSACGPYKRNPMPEVAKPSPIVKPNDPKLPPESEDDEEPSPHVPGIVINSCEEYKKVLSLWDNFISRFRECFMPEGHKPAPVFGDSGLVKMCQYSELDKVEFTSAGDKKETVFYRNGQRCAVDTVFSSRHFIIDLNDSFYEFFWGDNGFELNLGGELYRLKEFDITSCPGAVDYFLVPDFEPGKRFSFKVEKKSFNSQTNDWELLDTYHAYTCEK